MNLHKKVLLIGWDAADWKVIHPLMDKGEMPNLQRLVEAGAVGQIATLHPPLSPMLWTSIATGKRPFKHGIHGFAEPTPDAWVSGRSPICRAGHDASDPHRSSCPVGASRQFLAALVCALLVPHERRIRDAARCRLDEVTPVLLCHGVRANIDHGRPSGAIVHAPNSAIVLA